MKKSRREFLKLGAMTGGSLVLPGFAAGQAVNPRVPTPNGITFHGHVAHPLAQLKTAAPSLTPFVDPLPIPPVLRPSANGVTNIQMLPAMQKVHRDLPATPIWGFNGIWPGPTLEVRRGTPVKIKFHNDALPLTHPLPVDFSIHGAMPNLPQVRNVVHLHGAKILPESDGYPEAWISPNGVTGPELYNPDPFVYPNDQQSTMLWYHDHTLGITRVEDSLNIPKGQFEIPLLIQDRLFNPDGTLLYPVAIGGTHDYWIPEFFGDTMCVNGKAWPVLEVEPRRYRFRILNACNARFLNMTLAGTNANGQPHGMAGPMFYVIGTDGGLLPAPVPLNTLLQAPAERLDVTIDFTGKGGHNFVLTNNGPAPFPGGGEVVPGSIMMFSVSKTLSSPDTTTIPTVLNPHPMDIAPSTAVKTRDLVLTELDRASDGFPIIGLLDNKNWDDPVTEDPKAGSTEIWNLINDTGDGHPKHIHLVQFQILSRRAFDQDRFDSTGQLAYIGKPQAPAPEELNAAKDVVKAYPGTVTSLIMKFDLPTGTNVIPGNRYKFVWHCHILEHEDNEMMRPMDVIG
jgi:spore coat protein A